MTFQALDKAELAVAAVSDAFDGVGGRWRSLHDQALRAAISAALNLAESKGHFGNGNERRHLQLAYASAREALSAVRIARRVGVGRRDAVVRAHGLLDEVCAIVWPLLRRG
jgi:four helix bundle protein